MYGKQELRGRGEEEAKVKMERAYAEVGEEKGKTL